MSRGCVALLSVTGWLPILTLLATAPPVGSDAAPTDARLAIRPALSALERPLADAAFVRSAERAAPPPCVADVCQPRVTVPGFDQRVSIRGKRTELAVKLLDRARIEPLATAVWLLAATGIRLDYTPPQLESALDSGHGGWGHVQLLVRWRVDAWNTPVWPVRSR